ncbi:hypothetical protein L6452_10691 [Arctium lappa]|uniref:Uncharacterized protein n=1 Tax=Arctium lappa TaxID=4217 RepID=A0ACB9DML9_ARCLA|nr:hypothetical protein L6452_10691 [Arctium lappa]
MAKRSSKQYYSQNKETKKEIEEETYHKGIGETRVIKLAASSRDPLKREKGNIEKQKMLNEKSDGQGLSRIRCNLTA